jgi:hypothetical protein
MKKSLLVLFWFCCSTLCLSATEESPLIKKELSPFSNPGFEENLKDWGANNSAVYKTALASDGKTTCRVADKAFDGGKSLAIPMAEFVEPGTLHLARSFRLKQGGKYYVSAKVKTEGDARAFLRVVSSADEVPQVFAVQQYGSLRTVSVRTNGYWMGFSDHIVSEVADSQAYWREIGVTLVTTGQTMNVVNPDPETADCELRFGAFGQGTAYFDDIRVYELKDYSQYLRVKLLEPQTDKYYIAMQARANRPREYRIRTYFRDEGVEPQEHSPWIELNEGGGKYGRRFSGNPACWYPGVITAGFKFQTHGTNAFKKIKVQVDFAYGPDESKILKTITEENGGNILSLIFAREGAGPFEFANSFRLMREDAQDRNALVKSLNLPPVNLKKFHIETTVGGYNPFFSDPRIVELEMDNVAGIGINALTHLVNPYREVAARKGIKKTHQVHRSSTLQFVPKAIPEELEVAKRYPFNAKAMKVSPSFRRSMEEGRNVHRLNFDDMQESFAKAVAQWMGHVTRNDPGAISIISCVDVGDEIGGHAFAGKAYNEYYREYLKKQGISPSDFGKEKWEDIYPVTWGASNNPLPHMRPKDRTDVAACAQYYWSLKYWSWCNARMYRVVTSELEKSLPGITTRLNFGQPWYNAATDMRGTDCWEYARRRGITAVCNEDWVSTYSGSRFTGIQLNSYLADLNRSIAAVQNLGLQAYVMSEKERHIQRKLASVIGKGVKEINLFSYGPGYSSFDNWSQSFSMVKGVSKFIRNLAKAENVLYPGQPRKPEVAIVWSGSNEIWREKEPTTFDSHKGDTLYNGHYIHFGLLHEHVPVDFIDEVKIEEGGLSEYKVVYLSARNLRRKSQEALAKWVKEGGFLWTDALSGVEDEYGQACNILLPVIGIDGCNVNESALLDYRPEYGLPLQKPLDTITFTDSGETISAIGTIVKFSLSDPKSSDVLATFEDGSPAIIERKVGKGKVHYVGTLAGCSYGWTVKRVWGKIEAGYRKANRRLISDFPARVGAKMPLTCSVPLVEANLLESDEGIGIVLVDYAGEDPIDEVKLSVSVPSRISSISSVEHGELPFEYDKDKKTVDCSLPLDLVDILVLK